MLRKLSTRGALQKSKCFQGLGVCLGTVETLALLLPSPLLPMSASQQDHQIADTVRQLRPRLLQFIRRRIPDEAEAEDFPQDVFAELVESYRLLKPVEQAAA